MTLDLLCVTSRDRRTRAPAFSLAQVANISLSYWHYSSYCTTGPAR